LIKTPCKPVAPKAWIINIGTELLMGVTVNTNGSWIARKLVANGITTDRMIVVPDREDDVVEEIRRGIGKGVGLIVTTGGLGPTYDDSTAKFVGKALGRSMERNEEAYKMVEEKYRNMGEKMTPEREKMAVLPKDSVPIPNKVGTAPGFMVCNGKTLIISFPGVPDEMKSMFEEHVEPLLRSFTRKKLYEERITIKGIKESSLAPIVNKLAKTFLNAYIKSHPKGREGGNPVIELQISVITDNDNEAEKTIQEVKKKLWEELGRKKKLE
jgi:nicotinamide-nucleotide amidase